MILDKHVTVVMPAYNAAKTLDKTIREWYPSDWILRRAAELGIPLLLSADAHGTAEVARHFNEARERLAALGCRTCQFRRRQAIPLPA